MESCQAIERKKDDDDDAQTTVPSLSNKENA
jgi:hypothetical protein